MNMTFPAVLFFVFVLAANPCYGAASASIESQPFGTARDGKKVELYNLRNVNGVVVKVMTYGGILYSVEVPDRDGKFDNVTANRETLEDYQKKSACFGALVGRFANRIANARFALDGQEYQITKNAGANHIHGGAKGFDKCVWSAQPMPVRDGVALKLAYAARDGEEGYPGNLTCTVLYELSNDNELILRYSAVTDKPTVVNFCNHAYWNLAGACSGTVLDQVLQVNADKYLEADEALIPTGRMLPVEGTPVDFRSPRRIGERIGDIKEKQFNGGYDHCLVLNHAKEGDLVFCARLSDPKSGRTMEVMTTEPGVQIYSANFAAGAFEGPKGYLYPRHLGICLETQHFPDSPNKPQFPSTVLRPGKPFESMTIFKFGRTAPK